MSSIPGASYWALRILAIQESGPVRYRLLDSVQLPADKLRDHAVSAAMRGVVVGPLNHRCACGLREDSLVTRGRNQPRLRGERFARLDSCGPKPVLRSNPHLLWK
jgi:hypothetical protein